MDAGLASSGGGTRTHNPSVNSRMLCRLSYPRMTSRERLGVHSSNAGGSCAVPASTSAWQLEHEQHALRRFGPSRRHRTRHAAARQGKRFARRIQMMEMQPGERPVVAAEHAGAARFLDEHALDLAPAPVDRTRAAQPATESIWPAAHERRDPVNGTASFRGLSSRRSRRSGLSEPASTLGRQPMPLEPVANGRVRHAQTVGHGTNRSSPLRAVPPTHRDRLRREPDDDPRAERRARTSLPSRRRSTAGGRVPARSTRSSGLLRASRQVLTVHCRTNTSSYGGRNQAIR